MGSDTKIGGWKRTLTIHFSKSRWNHTIVKAESMAKELGINKYNVIPNGVDMRKLKSISSDNNLSVIFPADPSRESKNYNLAERAVSLVKESMPNLNFEICFGLCYDAIEVGQKFPNNGSVFIEQGGQTLPGNHLGNTLANDEPRTFTFRYYQTDQAGITEQGEDFLITYSYDPTLGMDDNNAIGFDVTATLVSDYIRTSECP